MQRVLKRLLDRLLALALLIAFAPLAAIIALAAWASAGRPILHRESRLGRGGHPFTLRKFRTLADSTGPSVAPDGDPRILPLGGFLRRWRLDELPQLFNVLAGEMSLVGPRPLKPEHARTLPAAQRDILLSVPPGITGPASLAFMGDDAVLGDSGDPEREYLEKLLPEKVAMELEYLAGWSLWSDVRVLVQTVSRTWSPAAHRRSRARVARLLDRSPD